MRKPDPIAAADAAYCRDAIRLGSKSFFAASRLLPRDVRAHAFALYAFCRRSDDVVDLKGGGLGAVEAMSAKLDRAYAGAPDEDPVDRAFARAVAAIALPRALPDALLDGLAWDAQGRRFHTLAELRAYAARVAGAVGAMMCVAMGVRERTALARACDLGVAMQLTNIARDIGEDARAGRIYAPLSWLEEAGLDTDAFLERPHASPEIAQVARRLVNAAAPLYERGLSGVGALPQGCRAAISAAGRIYREIGAEIAASDYDSVTRRAVVSKRRKLALLAQAAATPATTISHAPALPECGFLIDAAADAAQAPLPSRAAWLVDLFIRLENRDRAPLGERA